MKCHLKGLKETSSEDEVVGLRHVYYIKSYVLSAGIRYGTERYK
jgi:hypothetical protein